MISDCGCRVRRAAVHVAAAYAQAQAAKYPAKLVRFIVGFAPGGAVDVQARVVAQRLTETLGQSVIVENRPARTASSPATSSPKRRPTAIRSPT